MRRKPSRLRCDKAVFGIQRHGAARKGLAMKEIAIHYLKKRPKRHRHSLLDANRPHTRFLHAGNKEVPHAQPTGVQKAPRHEVAGSSAPAEQRALRGFVRGARLRKFEEWRPRPRAQLKRYGTIVAI